jgi:hypothetical protein
MAGAKTIRRGMATGCKPLRRSNLWVGEFSPARRQLMQVKTPATADQSGSNGSGGAFKLGGGKTLGSNGLSH